MLRYLEIFNISPQSQHLSVEPSSWSVPILGEKTGCKNATFHRMVVIISTADFYSLLGFLDQIKSKKAWYVEKLSKNIQFLGF